MPMKIPALPLVLLPVLSCSGCYPLYMKSMQLRQSIGDYRERRREAGPMTQTAVEYAPGPVVSNAPPAGREGVVGRWLHVRFEDAARDGAPGNPLAGWLRRGDGGMTVTVIRQLYDGRWLVRGQKALSGAGGYVQLEGIVDPRDIDGDGKVPSPRVAEPRLRLSGGRGTTETQDLAELARFFQGGG